MKSVAIFGKKLNINSILLLSFITFSLKIFVRLFIVMGVAWIFEGLSFLIDNDNDSHFFTIFDAWNALQGPIIFFSFIMRRRVLFLIKKRSVVCGRFCYIYVSSFICIHVDVDTQIHSNDINYDMRVFV